MLKNSLTWNFYNSAADFLLYFWIKGRWLKPKNGKHWFFMLLDGAALLGLQSLSVIIFDKRTLSNFEVKPVYPMNAASNLNSLCCVAHIRGQSDFFWLLAWDNLCKAQHKHIRNEWSQEHPVKIQFPGQDKTYLHNPIFDDILMTPENAEKCQISPTLANWPLAWLAGATQGRLKNSPLLSSLSSQFFYQVHPKLILLSRVKISWRAVIMVSSPTIFSKKVQTLLTILCWNLSCNICSFLIAHIIGEVELQLRFEANPVEYILTGSPAWDSFKACSSCPCVCDQTNKP